MNLSEEPIKRRLVAIMAADMVGYSRLMQLDEAGTVQRQRSIRKEVVDPKINQFGGRIVKTTGDGLLVEFSSVVDAVQCAAVVQQEMSAKELDLPPDNRIRYRVGINLGDIIIDGNDILGDGVNVASRIEGLADAGGICVSASVYEQVRGKTGNNFEDAGEHLVKNIREPVRVYRMVMGIHTHLTQPKGTDRHEQPRRRKASVAVLPFENLSNDQQMQVVTEGLVDDILTGLQRFRLVSVISKNSTSRLKGRQVSANEIRQHLKADYFIEGSIRKAAGFARVTVQLIDCHNDEHIWAQRFDRSLDNPFDLQDEVSSAVIAAVEPVLIDAEIKHGISLEPGYAHESKLKRAAWHLYRYTKEDCDTAIRFFEEAIIENPSASGRHEALAMGYLWRLTFGWADDPKATIAKAINTSKKATDLAPNDAYKHAVRAWALIWGGSGSLATSEIERAHQLNPQSAMTTGVQAFVAGHIGAADVAIEAIQKSLALSKDSPFLFQYATGAALGYFARNDWREAAQYAETATLRRPNCLSAWAVLASASNAMGNDGAAASAYLTLTELCPHVTEHWLRSFMPILDEKLKNDIFSNLQSLGLPRN